jgi:hypothetical protein
MFRPSARSSRTAVVDRDDAKTAPRSTPDIGSPRHATTSRAAGRSILAGSSTCACRSADDPRGSRHMSQQGHRFFGFLFVEGNHAKAEERLTWVIKFDIPTTQDKHPPIPGNFDSTRQLITGNMGWYSYCK